MLEQRHVIIDNGSIGIYNVMRYIVESNLEIQGQKGELTLWTDRGSKMRIKWYIQGNDKIYETSIV